MRWLTTDPALAPPRGETRVAAPIGTTPTPLPPAGKGTRIHAPAGNTALVWFCVPVWRARDEQPPRSPFLAPVPVGDVVWQEGEPLEPGQTSAPLAAGAVVRLVSRVPGQTVELVTEVTP